MNLRGIVNFKGEKYFAINKRNTTSDKWIILSPMTRADANRQILGQPTKDNVLDSTCYGATLDHVLEYYDKKLKSGKVDVMKKRRTDITNLIVDSIITFKIYGYQSNQIVIDNEFVNSYGNLRRDFEANTPQFSVSYSMSDKQFTYLKYKSELISFELEAVDTVPTPKIGADLVESASRTFKERVFFTNVADIKFENLAKAHDLSWYKNKKYIMIENNEQFEKYVMTPLLKTIALNKKLGQKTLLAMDTETTGLGIFKLFAGSEQKDHIVTMQLSWEDNQAVLINFDMEVFDNVDHDYVRDRLHPLVKEYIGKDREKPITMRTMEGEVITFCRNDILVIGHNTIFDGKVTIDMGAQWFFDEDTLEMIFDLNAGDSKGEKGLKKLSKRLLGIDQLQLSDTLGKNNEDKFRYITDKEVALVYGGADSDCTRMVWKILYSVMPPRVYKAYKKYHMYMWYILAQSEYDGIKLKEEVLKKNATLVEHNLQAIENFIYTYVGKKIIEKEIKDQIVYEVEHQGVIYDNPKEEYYKRLEQKDMANAIHRFNINGADVRDILYETLGYPVIAYTNSGLPATNKDTLLKLSQHTRNVPSTEMKDHLISEDGETILIDKNKFNNYRFPLCYVLLKYKDLYKEYRGYYLPFQKSDMGGYLYKGFSTTNIETFRISNPVQTTKKDLKKCIGAYDDDWYPVNWDMAQVEARVFVSQAKDERMIERLNDSENDYHTETAATMYSIPPYTVTKPLRKASKTINFGLPYGLGPKKMCERIHGVITDDFLFDTKLKVEIYKKTNAPTWNLLQGFRDSALDIWDCPTELRKVIGAEGKILGKVENAVGLYRVFDLTNVTESWQKDSVRRAAGNFPIQSFAACIFKLIIIRLFIRLGKEGLRDKFKIHMLVHDEIQCSVHKSIDPVYLMKIFKEECMIHIKGHATYFIGINFGDSWYECKRDENECPVNFVLEMIDKLERGEYIPRKWTDNPKDILDPAMHIFFKNRIYREFIGIQPTLHRYIDYDKLIEGLQSYTVRAYVTDKFPKTFKYDKDNADDAFLSHLMGWTYEYFQVDNFDIVYKNKAYKANELIDLMDGKAVDVSDVYIDLYEEEISDENWDLDDQESVTDFFITKYTIDDEEDTNVDPRSDLEKFLDGDFEEEDNFVNLEVRNKLIFIRIDTLMQMNLIKSQLTQTQSKDGLLLKFELRGIPRGSLRVVSDTNLKELDRLVTEVKTKNVQGYNYLNIDSFKM
ncbi:DNA polymerase [Clostridium perfringens]|uniref:DNA polymerase n=1 Tax=Clostridium perfringens TaxID=1502 RepID=UPI0024BD496B|nr:DNA polymerase [Clostridium perfringens]